MKKEEQEIPVIQCFVCGGDGRDQNGYTQWLGSKCWKCQGSGKVFWASGYAHPYTPEGEKAMRRALGLT